MRQVPARGLHGAGEPLPESPQHEHAMIDVATPQMKRPRAVETKAQLPLRAQTDIYAKTRTKPARTGPTLPFLDEFSAQDARNSIAAHMPSLSDEKKKKKKRCWSANF